MSIIIELSITEGIKLKNGTILNEIVNDVFMERTSNAVYEYLKEEVLLPSNIIEKEAICVVSIVNDEEIRQLNRDFAGKDKPTNVLSFAADEEIRAIIGDFEKYHIGDIAISYETLYNESIEYNKSFEERFSHMLVHGILHILGYDHMNQEEAEIMENLESMILERLGIYDPYEIND